MNKITPGEAAALEAAGVKVIPDVKQSDRHMDALSRLGYTFRVNLMDHSLEVNGQPMTDFLQRTIRRDMRDIGFSRNLDAVEDSYIAHAVANAYHPVRDYLQALVWDGYDHIGLLGTKLIAPGDVVTYPDGSTLPLSTVYLYRWLVGVVGKIVNYEQNPMLVLDAPQGLGKSQFVRWLCPLPSLFHEGPIDVHDKDALIRLMNKLVWEVSEIDGTTRRADVAALKSFITTDTINVRRSYGRYDITGHASCSFVGTVNNSTGFLADETGSRRFRIVHLQRIDWTYAALDKDQVWGQAYMLYKDGERAVLADDEESMRITVNQRYEIATPIDDWIAECFELTGDEADMLTSGAIIAQLDKKGHALSGSERSQAMEISRILTRYGAKSALRRINGVPSRCWLGITYRSES